MTKSLCYWALALSLLLSLAGCAAAPPPQAPQEAANRQADQRFELQGPQGEGQLELFLSTDRRRGFFTLSWGPDESWTSPLYPMWKAAVADIDGDGIDEVLVGIWSWRQRHDEPQPHRTVWVLAQHGPGLKEGWRGSALARPLIDFWVEAEAPLSQGRLVTREHHPKGEVITRYSWTGFGFAGLVQAPSN